MVLTREQYTRSGEAIVVLPDRRKPRGSTKTKMGSEDDKNLKLSDEDKFAKLELKIQDLADTLVAFVKLEIYDYNGVMEDEKLDGWLDKLETYFTVHQLVESQKISFASLKLSNHASTWWKAYKKRYVTENMTWHQFKNLMRKHFYPVGYLDERWYKWQHLRQRYQQSVQDYTTEFYNQALVLDVDITSDETFRKYNGGLVDYIRRELKLFSVQDIEDAINKAVAIEQKVKGAAGSDNNRLVTRGKDMTQIRVETNKDKSLLDEQEEKVCDHCKEKGHIKDTCWTLYPHLKPKKLREAERQRSFKKNTMIAEAVDTEIISEIDHPDPKLLLMTKLTDAGQENLHEELFHVKIKIKQSIVEAIIDSGSQKNLISEKLVEQMGLSTTPHPKPYPLGWIQKDTELQVSMQCRFKFAITDKFIDEIVCDVVPLDVAQVIFGNPYLWERDAVLYHRERVYLFKKDGKDFRVQASKTHLPMKLVTTNQVKRLINACEKFSLVIRPVIKEEKKVVLHTTLSTRQQSEPSSLKKKFVDLFQEEVILPRKRGVKHEIALVGDAMFFTKLDLESGYNQVRIKEEGTRAQRFIEEKGKVHVLAEDLWIERDEVLEEDCIIETKVTPTRRGDCIMFRVGRVGQVPSKARWFNKEQGEAEFPHLQFRAYTGVPAS
ncbi:uncharacterized protein LOC113295860 [Papaver somniferum]|uniref:uncharacterized protein LOC113295860 n=1 Tax=Papaver somniferum TaxID=3469 RepID=UPI000E70241B|nr:uncharacterized protein LOC113295860 [Papaver somniferum]